MARRRKKGPSPSLLPQGPAPVEGITADEVRILMREACWRKKPYPTQRQARADAAALVATGSMVEAYRCPFHSLHEAKHWHVGHQPPLGHLERIAATIRWCAQHPDEVPQPHPSVRPPG